MGRLLTQARWRWAGGICLALCCVMAGFGVRLDVVRQTPVLFLLYWGLFLALFLVTLFCALLDLRHIRAEYAVAQRETFRDTLGDEAFRAALRAALREAGKKAPPSATSSE